MIALCNQKGGVGKTTTTINLGAALAETGRRVLLVDFDPQGALSVGLGVNPHELDLTVYNLLMRARRRRSTTCCSRPSIPGMDLLPSNIDLSAAEVQLVSEVAREQTLSRVLAPVLADYDYVLIDCQPSPGPADGERADRRARRDHPAGVRVLRAARSGPADGHHHSSARKD